MQSSFPEAAGPFLLWLAAAVPAAAQVVNPADAQKSQEPQPEEQDRWQRLRSWELPETVVEGERISAYFGEDRVGSYGQPR